MRFSRTFHKKLFKCNSDFVEQLKHLTFGYNGMMLHWIERNDTHTCAVYVYDKEKKIAAWACIIQPPGVIPAVANIGFYTDPKYRRQGLALRLARYISKYHNKLLESKITYAPHDIASGNFFDKCKNKDYFNDTNSQSGI